MNTSDDLLLSRLIRLGAPLSSVSLAEDNPPAFAEIFVQALSFARRNPAVSRVMPLVIARNRLCFRDFRQISELARNRGESDTLGFFLDMTGQLSGEKYFADLADTLFPYRIREMRSFFANPSPSPRLKKLEELKTPPLARKWGFRMNMDTESFADIFNKFKCFT